MKYFIAFIVVAGLCVSCGIISQPEKEGITVSKKKKTASKTPKKKTTKKKPTKNQVKLTTNKGEITIELDTKNSPITTKNFLKYVDEGFYSDTIFHRVIPNFMIQCGGFDTDMNEKGSGKPIKNEAQNGLKNDRGTLAMARTQVVDSATSQFFINVKDNSFLNNSDGNFGYAVFGKVIDGMDVVDEIAAVQTSSKGYHDDVPVENVIIIKAERIN